MRRRLPAGTQRYHESEIAHFLMKMENARFSRFVPTDNTTYAIPAQANLENGMQE